MPGIVNQEKVADDIINVQLPGFFVIWVVLQSKRPGYLCSNNEFIDCMKLL